MTVKRRRVHLKSHSDCFLGSEAVDVLAEHISCIKAFESACACWEVDLTYVCTIVYQNNWVDFQFEGFDFSHTIFSSLSFLFIIFIHKERH